MNWYYEKQGVSRGPFVEEEFRDMVKSLVVPLDGLVWHPGMTEWRTLEALQPEWLETLDTEESSPVLVGRSAAMAAMAAQAGGTGAAGSRPPLRRIVSPKAPSVDKLSREVKPESKPKNEGGFLKRLFRKGDG